MHSYKLPPGKATCCYLIVAEFHLARLGIDQVHNFINTSSNYNADPF